MTHYAVILLFTNRPTKKDIEIRLAPFDENIEVESYYDGTTREEVQRQMDEIKERCAQEGEKSYILKYNPKIFSMSLEEFADDWYEQKLGKEGLLTNHNPQSKWDWYQIGGRYNGFFYHKDGSTLNMIQIKDLDLSRHYKETLKILNKKLLWEQKFDSINEIDSNLLSKEEYHHYVSVLFGHHSTKTYLEINEKNHGFPLCYAVIDLDGVWHEAGKMGWFAVSHASDEELIEFKSSIYNRFIKDLSSATWLVVVDCHT